MQYQDKPADPKNYLPPEDREKATEEAKEALRLLDRLLAHPPPGVDVQALLDEWADKGADQVLREQGIDPDNMPDLELDELRGIAEYFEKKYPNPSRDGESRAE